MSSVIGFIIGRSVYICRPTALVVRSRYRSAMTPAVLSDPAQLFSVKGLVAVVTGGATGIGLMLATALETNGATVYIVGRRTEALEKAVKEHSNHGNLIPLQGDVSSKESLRAMADIVKARSGYVNLLINNAGVSLAHQPKLPTPSEAHGDITQLQTPLWETETLDSFRKTIDVNVAAVWFGTVAFMELLHEGNKRTLAAGGTGVSSQVLTISSIAAYRKDSAVFSLSYTVSKAAVTHLGKMMAHYLKDWKIRSNVICPGLFPSEMIDEMDEAVKKVLEASIVLKRVGTTDDMTGLVLFLASKAGSYIDGGVLSIDGGRLVQIPTTA
ncbi:NAD-P-binding protein [Fomitopsis serialis]|uniref:NAD-P-binding protein n=1 Tax=Fomitopsis serialis TaxID=139415 RepID=UPI002007A156|nr:NAD-P-binding protein [Neoantrodia serialis]KAH9919312.1 NAD-P-binding protein [Neoantrodia serialis]